MFYAQLLGAQMVRRSRKRKKRLTTWLSFLRFWDRVKAACRMWMKLTPWADFINICFLDQDDKFFLQMSYGERHTDLANRFVVQILAKFGT